MSIRVERLGIVTNSTCRITMRPNRRRTPCNQPARA